MKTFILLSAMPGSGKSTWAKRYQETHPNTIIVSSDEIRMRLFGSAAGNVRTPIVWDTFLNDINDAAAKYENVTVIADSTNLSNKWRRYYLEETHGFDKHVLVLFDIPYEVSCFQNKLRSKDRVLPDEAMERLHKEYEMPTDEIIKLYDEYIVIRDFISDEAKKKFG